VSRQSKDDDEGERHLLRGIKTISHVRVTCTVCGHVRQFERGYPKKLWDRIEKTDRLPPVWSMACKAGCCEHSAHFVDWPA